MVAPCGYARTVGHELQRRSIVRAFADGVRDSPELRLWLLSETKFSERMSIRPRKRWWRHWWCVVPGLEKARETDIFMVFEAPPDRHRFALHIENKRDRYKFNDGQAAAYTPRAQSMLNKPEYLSHSDYQTVLLAPSRFRDRHEAEASLFDIFISYEAVARFLPAFATTQVRKQGVTGR